MHVAYRGTSRTFSLCLFCLCMSVFLSPVAVCRCLFSIENIFHLCLLLSLFVFLSLPLSVCLSVCVRVCLSAFLPAGSLPSSTLSLCISTFLLTSSLVPFLFPFHFIPSAHSPLPQHMYTYNTHLRFPKCFPRC